MQFLTGILWGQLSDRYGKVLRCGLFGTMPSSFALGFSSRLGMALLARTASGVSNYGCRARTQQGAPCESLYNHAHDIQYRFCLGPPLLGGYRSRPRSMGGQYGPPIPTLFLTLLWQSAAIPNLPLDTLAYWTSPIDEPGRLRHDLYRGIPVSYSSLFSILGLLLVLARSRHFDTV